MRRAPLRHLMATLSVALVTAGIAPPRAEAQGTDTTPPTIDVVAPSEDLIADPAPTIVIEYGDVGSGIRLVSLAISLDGVDLRPRCEVTITRATCTPEPLADGPHTVEASVRDRAGNAASTSAEFTTDATPPSIDVEDDRIFFDGFETGDLERWSEPALPALVTNDATPRLIVDFADSLSGLDLTTFALTVDGVDGTASCVVGPRRATCLLDALLEGVYDLGLSIDDLAGNQANLDSVLTIDLTPPTVTPAADPPPNAAGWNAEPVTVTFDCQDALAGIARCPAAVSVDEDGNRTLRGVAIDNAGNFATVEVEVKIDRADPVFDPDLLRPLPCPALTANLLATTMACFDDGLSGVGPGDVQLIVDGVDRTASAVVAADCVTWEPDVAYAIGEHQAQAIATDLAGNQGTIDWCFNIRSPTLEITIDTPIDGFATADATVDVTGTVDAFTQNVTVNGVVATITGGTYAAVGVPLDEGANLIQADATNDSGGLGMASVGVVRDSTPPTISAIVTPEPNASGWHNGPVTVSFDCTDDGVGIATCPDPVVLGGEGVDQEVRGTAVDGVGNTAEAVVLLDIDLTPPTIGASVTPAANGAGWHDSPPTITFDCNDPLSGIVDCSGPRLIGTEGADQVFTGVATDAAGNTATVDATVSVDLTAPTFDQAALRPLRCPNLTTQSRPRVEACFDDAVSSVDPATVTLIVDGVDQTAAATVAAGCVTWDPAVGFGPGEHQATATASDIAGNAGAVDWCFQISLPAVAIAIDTPLDGFATRDNAVDVTGTVEDGITQVTVNGVVAQVAGPSFTALGVPIREGRNVITAIATADEGNTGTASVVVQRDTTAPRVAIETPRNGAVLTSLQVDVAGMVNDLIAGTTINADDCDVTINGVEAAVANRSFLVSDLLLTRGPNTLTAVATDRLGNSTTTSIDVMVEDRAGQRIVLLAGNNQSAGIFQEVPDRLVVALENANGDPVVGRPVRFEVSRGTGSVSAFPDSGTEITVLTDDLGQASVTYELGARSGAGNNRVLATAAGFIGEVEFCATATSGTPVRVVTTAGDQQRGVVDRALASPLVVLVTDDGGNPVGGVVVTFEILDGGGSFGGLPTSVVTTDLDGLAEAVWTLGPDAGVNNNQARATFAGLLESGASFSATGRRVGPPGDTRLSGVVLDNQDNPVPGATVDIEGTALLTTTDDEGQFVLEGVPVGVVELHVDGGTTTRDGTWASLAFEVVTTAGQDNDVGRPIYLLPLDMANTAPASSSQDVTLRLANVPGAELTVFGNSVTCADGTTNCEVSVTQVRNERVPMEPPLGSNFMLAWTIQPEGATFDPPARICIPNADQLPGAQVEVFSFDHDQNAFIAVGTATVSEDGAQICSDPGFGIVKAGWHSCTPPPPPCNPGGAGSCDDNDDNVCTEKRRVPQECGFMCEPVNTDGRSCDDDDKCTDDDVCMGNRCMGEEIEVKITDAPVAICVGETKTATAMITPSSRSITWESGDTSKLTVTPSGTTTTLTGVSTGTFFRRVKITAKDSATDCSSDDRRVEVIERDDFTGFFTGSGEKTWCVANAINPVVAAGCARGYQLARQVQDWEATTFPPRCRGRDGDPGDAARHARWACELHSDPLTTLVADELLRRHENQRDDPCISHEQDLNNNDRGRDNGRNGRDCAASALSDLAGGRLQVNNPPAGGPCP